MKSKLAAIIANSGLLVVVLVLLSAPLLMGQLLGEYETGALGARTTNSDSVISAPQTGQRFAVYPNVSDFTNYASFSDQPMIGDNFYQTDITFTAFSGQQAAYNALFTVYNTSHQSLELTVEGSKLTTDLPDSQVWVSAILDGAVASSLVTEPAETGDTELKVAQADGFTGGNVVVGDLVLSASPKSGTSIELNQPLEQDIKVGEKIYFNPIYYGQKSTPNPAKTVAITLPPQQKVVINLAVATPSGSEATTQSVLPLTIMAK